MRRVFRWIGTALVVLAGAGVLTGIAARFADGPIGPFRGGRLAGEMADAPVNDWGDVLENGDFIEIEVNPDDPYSVQIDAHLRDGKLYSWSAWEHQWNTHAIANPRVLVRVGNTLHERRAVQVVDEEEWLLVHSPTGRSDEPAPTNGVAFRFDPAPRSAPPE